MITYFGSKSRIGKWIVEYYPQDIEIMVEPFGGAFWCYFNMDLSKFKNLHTVVYNDFNTLNANLFRCIKNHEEFYEELIQHPCQEYQNPNTPPEYQERFNTYQKEVFNPNLILTDKPDFNIGAKYAYVISQTFSGISSATTKFVDLKGKYRSKYLSFVDKFKKEDYINHINKITFIENMDFEDVIKKYDSNKTLLYLDPPYKERESKYSNHNFVSDTHERLMKVLKNTQSRWCLSYYDFPELSDWYPKEQYIWETKDYKKASGALKGKKQSTGTELLIMNYTPTIPLSIIKNKRKTEDMETNEIQENHDKMIENDITGTTDNIVPLVPETKQPEPSKPIEKSDDDNIDIITEIGYQLLFGDNTPIDKKLVLKSIIVSSIKLCLNGKL